VAAGSGERLGALRPKAFVVVGGRAMWAWSVAALAGAGITQVVLVVPPGAEAGPEAGTTRRPAASTSRW
jgi:choline kinase